MDFKSVQGAGETRLAAAAGVPSVIVGLSEGMQGSSLNAGNYNAAKKNFADRTLRQLWGNAASSLEVLFTPPPGSALWYDDRDIAFLREDAADRANIQQTNSISIRNYTDAGFTPDSAVAAVLAEDESLLVHSGLFSVQLQPADSEQSEPVEPDDDDARSQPVFNIDARTEVHTAPVDARVMPGAVNASSSNNPPEMVARAIADTVEAVVPQVVDRAAEQLSLAMAERDETTEGLVAVLTEQTEAITELRAEVAKPKPLTRKRVFTDEIGRITAIEEEQI
jgi:hypothetical protein